MLTATLIFSLFSLFVVILYAALPPLTCFVLSHKKPTVRDIDLYFPGSVALPTTHANSTNLRPKLVPTSHYQSHPKLTRSFSRLRCIIYTLADWRKVHTDQFPYFTAGLLKSFDHGLITSSSTAWLATALALLLKVVASFYRTTLLRSAPSFQ